MSDNVRITLAALLYTLFVIWAMISLIAPAEATDYVGNHVKIPTVHGAPPQVATWSKAPKILVCQHAPISMVQAHSAKRFWERLGYEFQGVSKAGIVGDECSTDSPNGYILIHLVTKGVKLEETSLAQTRFYVDNLSNTIQWAVIYLRPDVRERILEHEIGHALGFLHFNETSHIMNEKWTIGGWDTEGLDNRRK
jgi:hypothetical protein